VMTTVFATTYVVGGAGALGCNAHVKYFGDDRALFPTELRD